MAAVLDVEQEADVAAVPGRHVKHLRGKDVSRSIAIDWQLVELHRLDLQSGDFAKEGLHKPAGPVVASGGGASEYVAHEANRPRPEPVDQ
ncbi:hypothetical protein LBW59_25295, partial [Ralstonia solanacearum]